MGNGLKDILSWYSLKIFLLIVVYKKIVLESLWQATVLSSRSPWKIIVISLEEAEILISLVPYFG